MHVSHVQHCYTKTDLPYVHLTIVSLIATDSQVSSNSHYYSLVLGRGTEMIALKSPIVFLSWLKSQNHQGRFQLGKLKQVQITKLSQEQCLCLLKTILWKVASSHSVAEKLRLGTESSEVGIHSVQMLKTSSSSPSGLMSLSTTSGFGMYKWLSPLASGY